MPESQRATRIRTALIGVIFIVWGITFGAVGLGSDGLTSLCIGEEPVREVAGYTWARDHTNDCAWTLYSGTFPIRHKAPATVYYANGLNPPDTSPMLETWQIVILLVAIGTTGVLGLWHERIRKPEDEKLPLAAAPVDA